MSKVYIIHGWTYSLDKWQALSQELQRKGLEPVFLRVPGLTEPSDQVWDIDGYIDWLDKQLGAVQQPVVIGHSNGGRIALSYVQKYPGRLGRLILIDSAGIINNATKAQLKLKTLQYLSKVGKIFSYIPPLKKIFYKVIGAQDYNNAPPNMKKTMQQMLAADKRLNLSSIRLPVTLIWGQEDSITPLSDGQTLQAGISGAKLHIIEGARHAPFFTHPEAVAAIIAETLKESS